MLLHYLLIGFGVRNLDFLLFFFDLVEFVEFVEFAFFCVFCFFLDSGLVDQNSSGKAMVVMDLLPFDGALIKSGVNFSDLEKSSIKLFAVADEVSGREANMTPVLLLI